MPLNSPPEHIPGFEYRATARVRARGSPSLLSGGGAKTSLWLMGLFVVKQLRLPAVSDLENLSLASDGRFESTVLVISHCYSPRLSFTAMTISCWEPR